MNLSHEDVQKIFGGNAARLFGIPLSGTAASGE